VEIGQSGMGSPPWKDLGRYLRNSPLTYVERVQTPVLWSRLETVGEKTTKTEDFDLLPMLPVFASFCPNLSSAVPSQSTNYPHKMQKAAL
jgi:hypothetical protein